MNIQIDTGFNRLSDQFKSNVFKKDFNMFMRKALNTTAQDMRAPLRNNLKSIYSVKNAPINKTISIRKATTTNLMASIISRGPRLSLVSFSARQNKKGVNVKVKQSSSKTLLPHQFIAQMKSGHIGVFKRSSTKFMINNPKRQAIEETDSLSVAHGLSNDIVEDKNNKDIYNFLVAHIKDLGKETYNKMAAKVYGF